MTDIEREAMELWEWVAFLDRTKVLDKYKALIQFKTSNQRTAKINFLRNKNNVQPPFLNTFAPVSLQCDIPFPNNISLAFDVH